MKAAVVKGPGQFEIVEMPAPDIAAEEVLVKISVCGLCMSEYPLWLDGTAMGRQMGHEAVGVVVKVGGAVKGLKAGDRVSGIFDKCFAEYAVAPCANIVKVPDNLLDYEAISEPLACMASAVERVRIKPGDSVAMVGTGYMGLVAMQLFHVGGADKIIAVDTRGEGLANALKFGAAEAWLPDDIPARYKLTAWQGDLFAQGLDVVFEATGTPQGLALAGDMVKPHGTLLVAGYHQSGGGFRNVNMELWNWKGITVVNAHERRVAHLVDCCRNALGLVSEGKLNVEPLYTHRYGLDEINAAFADMKNKPQGYVKGFVEINAGEHSK